MSDRKIKIPIKGTRAAIFFHLLKKESTAVELKGRLGINESAVRRHLDILERDGIVVHYFDKASVGRPKKKYRLTELGRKLIPQRTDVFVSLLARKIASTYGKRALISLMEGVSEDLAKYFLPGPTRQKSEKIERRLKKMVKLFDDFGFIASVSKRDGEHVIIYRNCAFGDVLPELGGLLCEMHRKTVMKILGTNNVRLRTCIPGGEAFCSHVVRV